MLNNRDFYVMPVRLKRAQAKSAKPDLCRRERQPDVGDRIMGIRENMNRVRAVEMSIKMSM